MKKEDRHIKAFNLMKKISMLNDRSNIFSEYEEEAFLETMKIFDINNPGLWTYIDWNRQQGYSNLYAKLLVAYLIAEIKSGNLLDERFLNTIRKWELDEWEDFHNYDIGYKSAAVLEATVHQVIEQEGFYKISGFYIDYSHLIDSNGVLHITEKDMNDLIYEEVSQLKGVVSCAEIEREFSNIFWALECHLPLDIEVEIIESKVLYQILDNEKKHPSDLGGEIITLSKKIFLSLMREDYLTYDLSWEIIDHEEKKVCYYLFTCSEMLGDGYVFEEEVADRLHRYHYERIFQIMELQKKIQKYISK